MTVFIGEVRAISKNYYGSSFGPDKAIDGNPGSFFISGTDTPQWFQLDMGRAKVSS